ncbi:osmosensitive K+ channel signal transduction histidine kinase [Candidatus Protochlamydia naegleriophila]|uniref:histidine kinase n=1 Tax=Candidatus Protochlamydia naegleriophila TaxID=389348 RepID=A0A0U5EUN4_9BACT|nr:sensor histidine kinase KdpD [Candidatus Protochlamydia naegleriophila]CUI17987.1 osmosensitive K+ channel signal transduction histidine kinase [Candidatus Protochlamydia naegleriophila]
MIDEDDRLSPDEILKAIQKQESQKELGKLKIFFGMSAGVGKTYSMLQEAQQRLKEGVNVVIGTINTHGRKETEALLEGLPIIPEKWVKYKDTVFEELDLETIIDTKPELVLVDELAHTNMPGSKHPKRWQDVIEILDAGIDVYTTLNVQHIESRKDIVESLTGIQIRETVPDLILERATSIELIDIPPPELLRRLQEGKVYLGEQSRVAAENFFQEENLMALREIALRFTAEKVDHDLHGMLHGKGWKTRERLMVAISASPSSEQLIRAARRLSFELDAPWIAVHIDTGVRLNDQDQARLNRHFNLARELGAEVITTHDLDIAAALQRIARQRDITRIVIGRPPKKKFNPWTLFQGSFIDRLENENKHIDIVILRQEKLTNIYQRAVSTYQMTSPWSAYGLAIAFGIVITAVGLAVSPLIGYKSVGFIFLLGILILSFFVGRGPIFLAAVLSAVCWDLLFIPPLFTQTISDPEDITLVIIYFFVAAIMGTMTSRMREQDQFLHKREENTERLYEIERDIANATNLQYLRLNVCSRLENMFSGKFDILTKSPDNQLIIDGQLPLLKEEKERVAADWVFQNGKVGGWSTDTLPSAEGIYFPIKFSKSTVGVLVYFPKRGRSLSMEEMSFIQTVAQQLGIYLERYIFEERVSRQDYTRQIERMHQSIFHSLNRSFYTPLKEISKINHQIQQAELSPHIRSLVSKMEQFISNIKFTVDNIIAMSELESGFVHFDRKKHAIKELIEHSLNETKPFVNGHPIKLKLPSQPMFLPFDFNLLKLALNNLLLNAIEYSPSSSPIFIKVQVLENEFWLSVIDEGPGIPEDVSPLIFDKFYHVSSESKGLGLGLAIVKSVVDIHQRKIEVKNREEKGTEFSLILPI